MKKAPPIQELDTDVVLYPPNPKHGKPLRLGIDIGAAVAMFHCRKIEKLTDWDGKTIIFKADSACTILVLPTGVLDQDYIPLDGKNSRKVMVRKSGLNRSIQFRVLIGLPFKIKNVGDPKIEIP